VFSLHIWGILWALGILSTLFSFWRGKLFMEGLMFSPCVDSRGGVMSSTFQHIY
jgi:hypothetical protein